MLYTCAAGLSYDPAAKQRQSNADVFFTRPVTVSRIMFCHLSQIDADN